MGFLRGARLAALVQRLRAGEDAAQPARPVDVRRLAGRVPPRRHRARAVPARARHEPEDLQPRPQRHRHASRGFADDPDAHASSSSIRARPRRRATATRHLRVRPGTDVYLLLGDGGGDRARGAGGRDASSPSARIGFEALRDALAAVDVARDGARCGLDGRGDRRDRARLRRGRVGGDLLRPRRRADAVLDAQSRT